MRGVISLEIGDEIRWMKFGLDASREFSKLVQREYGIQRLSPTDFHTRYLLNPDLAIVELIYCAITMYEKLVDEGKLKKKNKLPPDFSLSTVDEWIYEFMNRETFLENALLILDAQKMREKEDPITENGEEVHGEVTTGEIKGG